MRADKTGNKISESRKKLKMTQKDLAEKLHVTDKAVSKWERGLNYPDVSLFDDLASALDISVIELLCLEDKSKEEIVQTISEISQTEKKGIYRQMILGAIFSIIFGIILFISLIYASSLFAQNGIYGKAMTATTGMLSLTGFIIGNGLYTLIHIKKLK